jgi:hypothetical protein
MEACRARRGGGGTDALASDTSAGDNGRMAGRSAVGGVLRGVRRLGVLLVLLACGLSVPTLAAQPTPPPPADPQRPAQPPVVNVDELPISVERIQEGLQREPVLNLIPSRPLFRIEVIEVRPRWFDVEIDWTEGRRGLPTPRTPVWHSEFLGMVTPREAQSFGAFTGTDLLQVMATSLVQGLATQAVTSTVRNVLRERREAEAKREVDEAIARWKREREAAEAERNAASPEAPPRP